MDDTEIYVPVRPNSNYSGTKLLKCLENVKTLMADNLVQLNEQKTEMIIFGHTVCNKTVKDSLGPWCIYLQGQIKKLGSHF